MQTHWVEQVGRHLKKEYKKRFWAILPCSHPLAVSSSKSCYVRGQSCAVSLVGNHKSTLSNELFVLLGFITLCWCLSQFNYAFCLGNLCVHLLELFSRSLKKDMIKAYSCDITIGIFQFNYLFFKLNNSDPFHVFQYGKTSKSLHIRPAFSAFFLGLMHLFEKQWSEIQYSTWIHSGWIYSIKKFPAVVDFF